MKKEIIKFANSIEIEYIGFGSIQFNTEFISRLRERRENGHLSGFEEDDELKRIDLNSLLNNVKTIISIALPYKTSEPDYNKPYFSKSSLGLDYHKVFKIKLELLEDFLHNKYGANSIGFSDIGPLHDRELAQKSGVGFYGKNTNIITQRYGSFVFLGEILTDLSIEVDGALESKCGECTLCIDACPVSAIEKPYYINAQKCLSYISQNKRNLTEDEIDKLGMRIYGCDTCQDVCPYNKTAVNSTLSEFMPVKWSKDAIKYDLLNMTNSRFKDTFANLTSGWRGKSLLKRNLIIAMGNSGIMDYLEILKKIKDEKLEYYIENAIKKLENINKDNINI
jgi:epoxyqueuosine reductase